MNSIPSLKFTKNATVVTKTNQITLQLVISIASTLLLLVAANLTSNRLSQMNGEFTTKILLILAGISTSTIVKSLEQRAEALDTSDSSENLKTAFDWTSTTIHNQVINNHSTRFSAQENQLNAESNQMNQPEDDDGSDDVIDPDFSSMPSSMGNLEKIETDREMASVEALSLSKGSQLVVMEPHDFKEVAKAVPVIQDGKTLVLNLTLMNPDDAQRAVDFVAGANFGANGRQEMVGDSIFAFIPQGTEVEISSSFPLKERKRNLDYLERFKSEETKKKSYR